MLTPDELPFSVVDKAKIGNTGALLRFFANPMPSVELLLPIECVEMIEPKLLKEEVGHIAQSDAAQVAYNRLLRQPH